MWCDEIVSGTSDKTVANSIDVLKVLHPNLFTKEDPKAKGKLSITTLDASELLRKSLNRCITILRSSKESFNVIDFNFWAETYYQTSLLLFAEHGLTPYKLKLVTIPQIVEGNFVVSPWNHICEGLEKSNHHASKDFHTRTMRGGGKMCNHDPLFLESFFSFCKLLQRTKAEKEVPDVLANLTSVFNVSLGQTYLEICIDAVPNPRIAVGEVRAKNKMLTGMRFFVLGSFAGTPAVDGGNRHVPRLTAQLMMEKWIKEHGGSVYRKDTAETLLYSHSKTPHCYIVLRDETDLSIGTMTTEEVDEFYTTLRQGQTKKKKIQSESGTSDCNSENVERRNSKGIRKKSQAALICELFAGGDFQFLKAQFIFDTIKSDCVLDPENYILQPGSSFRKINVNDVRPLLMDQCGGKKTEENVSAISSLRKFRKSKCEESAL